MTTQCIDIKVTVYDAIDKAFEKGRLTELQRRGARKIAANSIFGASIQVNENEEVILEEGFNELIIQRAIEVY